jgi:type I restriction-modification system DNA methylase subunit
MKEYHKIVERKILKGSSKICGRLAKVGDLSNLEKALVDDRCYFGEKVLRNCLVGGHANCFDFICANYTFEILWSDQVQLYGSALRKVESLEKRISAKPKLAKKNKKKLLKILHCLLHAKSYLYFDYSILLKEPLKSKLEILFHHYKIT